MGRLTPVTDSSPECLQLASHFLRTEDGATEADIDRLAQQFKRDGEKYAAQLIRRYGNRYTVEFEHTGQKMRRIWYAKAQHEIGDEVTVDIVLLGKPHAKSCRVVVDDIISGV